MKKSFKEGVGVLGIILVIIIFGIVLTNLIPPVLMSPSLTDCMMMLPPPSQECCDAYGAALPGCETLPGMELTGTLPGTTTTTIPYGGILSPSRLPNTPVDSGCALYPAPVSSGKAFMGVLKSKNGVLMDSSSPDNFADPCDEPSTKACSSWSCGFRYDTGKAECGELARQDGYQESCGKTNGVITNDCKTCSAGNCGNNDKLCWGNAGYEIQGVTTCVDEVLTPKPNKCSGTLSLITFGCVVNPQPEQPIVITKVANCITDKAKDYCGQSTFSSGGVIKTNKYSECLLCKSPTPCATTTGGCTSKYCEKKYWYTMTGCSKYTHNEIGKEISGSLACSSNALCQWICPSGTKDRGGN